MDERIEILKNLEYSITSPTWEDRKKEIYQDFKRFKENVEEGVEDKEVLEQLNKMEKKFK